MGQWDNADTKINKSNAYERHVWVYSCVSAIARNIAQVPLKLYSKGTQKEIKSGPAYAFFENPSRYLAKSQLWEGTETYKQIRGEAFWHLLRGGSNIAEMEFLDPERMEQIVLDGVISGWTYTRAGSGQKVFIETEEVIHFKFFSPSDNYRGMSPLTAAMLGIQIDDDVRRFDKSVLQNGSYPGSLIEAPETMTDEEFARFTERMKAGNKGVEKAGSMMILEGGAKYRELKITPQEMQFLEKKRMAREETAAVFKVPPIEIGIFEDANRANAEVQTKMFWTKNLCPEMAYIEAVLNSYFFPVAFPGVECKFDLTTIKELADDLATAAQTAKLFYEMGVPFSVINQRMNLGFDLAKMPWRDTVLVNFSMTPIENVISGVAATPEEAPEETPEGEETPAQDTTRMVAALKSIDATFVDGNKIIPMKDKKHYLHWKRLIARLNPLIVKTESKVSRYIFEARQRVLQRYTDLAKSAKISGDEIFDESAELRELKKALTPAILEAIIAGGQDVFDELQISGTFDLVDQRAVDFFNRTIVKLKEITGTLREEVRLTIQEGIAQSLTNADIVEALKHDFNIAGNRARTIARTEVTSAANGGRVMAYFGSGIEKHEWVNSFDANVRELHQISEVVEVGTEFSNGLKWPGDKDGSGSSPENVINCRCTTIAIIEKGE